MNVCVSLNTVDHVFKNKEENDSYDKSSFFIKDKYKFDNNYFSGISNSICTKGFFMLHNSFNVKYKTNELYHVDDDFIQIAIGINGVSNVIDGISNTKIEQGWVQLAFRSNRKVEVEILPSDKFEYLRIFISRSYYIELLKDEHWANLDILYQNVINKNYIEFGELRYKLNYEIIRIIQELFSNQYSERYANYILQYKLKEFFLMHHINLENQDLKKVDIKDYNTLQFAKAYLEQNFINAPTIQELSRIVFLNEFKLKKGFKDLFHTTIHQYVIYLRMQSALHLLKDKNQIKEVAYLLGYKNTSHFISNFKTHYGYTPSKILNNLSD